MANRNDGPSDAFVEQVKQALERLYDFAFLQQHPLAQTAPAGETPGQTLRQELVKAIETLSPGPGAPFRAPHARTYNLLQFHYVEGHTIQETARDLGISVRQAYRDLRRGEESVAAILWAGRKAAHPAQQAGATRLSSVEAEIGRLETHARPMDIRPLLQQAQKAVERLARQQKVDFTLHIPDRPVIVSTDPAPARQILVTLLSYAVQQAQPGELRLSLTVDDLKGTTLLLQYAARPATGQPSLAGHVVVQLADRLGWSIQQTGEATALQQIHLHMTTQGPIVLVIDDNQGLVELLERYLTGHACRVLAATGGQEGLELAQQLTPDAVVLDVMMPELDGWEILQRLRARSQTANLPVIICSVFNDPELAYSLGATLFLPKPVKRNEVLTALRRLGIV